jgi:AcrR family transcriptional regulator
MQKLKQEIREKIINYAAHQFLKQGYNATSMRTIANQCGISVSNLYNYYKNKEHLFSVLTADCYKEMQQLVHRIKNHSPSEGVDNKIFVNSVIQNLLSIIKSNKKEFLLLLDKSKGTKYERFKNNLIQILSHHFIEEFSHKKNQAVSEFITNTAAKNIIYGLIDIAKHTHNDEDISIHTGNLINYHLHGILFFIQ